MAWRWGKGSIKPRWGGLASRRVRAALFYAEERRIARYEAQQAEEEAGNPGIFSADFSGDFE